MKIEILKDRFSVVRLSPNMTIPEWATIGSFWSATKTADELSIVCMENNVPTNFQFESGWRALKVMGPLDFSMVGVLASLATPLAKNGISIFALSTFDTDYLFVKEENLSKASDALTASGHQIISL